MAEQINAGAQNGQNYVVIRTRMMGAGASNGQIQMVIRFPGIDFQCKKCSFLVNVARKAQKVTFRVVGLHKNP